MNKKCQVFTPSDYVEKLLDNVGYKHDLYGKKIMSRLSNTSQETKCTPLNSKTAEI